MEEQMGQLVLRELRAIGFARVTDVLAVRDGQLEIRETSQLSPEAQAAIASVERSSGGIKVKFYDKLKALELLGKISGLFDGGLPGQQEQNNLLEALLAASEKEVDIHDLPELQQAAAIGHDLVESAESTQL